MQSDIYTWEENPEDKKMEKKTYTRIEKLDGATEKQVREILQRWAELRTENMSEEEKTARVGNNNAYRIMGHYLYWNDFKKGNCDRVYFSERIMAGTGKYLDRETGRMELCLGAWTMSDREIGYYDRKKKAYFQINK